MFVQHPLKYKAVSAGLITLVCGIVNSMGVQCSLYVVEALSGVTEVVARAVIR